MPNTTAPFGGSISIDSGLAFLDAEDDTEAIETESLSNRSGGGGYFMLYFDEFCIGMSLLELG